MKARLRDSDVTSGVAYFRSAVADNAVMSTRHVTNAHASAFQHHVQSPSMSGTAVRMVDLIELAAKFQRYDRGKLRDGPSTILRNSHEHFSQLMENCRGGKSQPLSSPKSPSTTARMSTATSVQRSRKQSNKTSKLALPSIAEERRPSSDVSDNDELFAVQLRQMIVNIARPSPQTPFSAANSRNTRHGVDSSLQRSHAPVCVAGMRAGAVRHRTLGCVRSHYHEHRTGDCFTTACPIQTCPPQRQKSHMRTMSVSRGSVGVGEAAGVSDCQRIESSSQCRWRMLTSVKSSVQSLVSLPSLIVCSPPTVAATPHYQRRPMPAFRTRRSDAADL